MRSRFPGFLLLLVVALGSAGSAASAGEPVEMLRETLPNGLQVVIAPLPWKRLVNVDVFYAAGAAAEPDSLAGLAHLAEHLLMDDAGEFTDGELARRLALYTTRSNASTSGATMRFTNECLPEFLMQVLRNEAARMGGARVDSVEFERERRVIQEELAYRARLTAWRQFQQDLFRSAYRGHAFGRDAGGDASTLARIGPGDYSSFVDRNLTPSNAVLVITGPIDAGDVLQSVRDVFATGSGATPRRTDFGVYPEPEAGQWIDDTSEHDGFRVGIACRIPLADGGNLARAAVLREFLQEEGLGVSTWTVPGEVVLMIDGLFTYFRGPTDALFEWGYVYPDVDPEQDAQRVLAYLWTTVGETIDAMGVAAEYAERRDDVLERLGGRGSWDEIADLCGPALLTGAAPLSPDSLRTVAATLDGPRLQEFAARWLDPGRAAIGIRHGRDSGRMATIDLARRVAHAGELEGDDSLARLDRERIEPVLEAHRRADLFPVERFELENGIPVLQVTLPGDDRWRLAGRRTFPPLKELRAGNKPGLDALYNRVVDYGKSERNFDEGTIRPRLRPYGLRVALSPCCLEYRAAGSTAHAEDVVATVARRLRSDDFNPTRLSQILRVAEASLTRYRENARNASRAWRWSRLLGPEHPAAAQWAPDPALADEAGYKDLKKLHGKTAGKAGNTILVVAGALPPRETEALLSPQFDRFGERGRQKFKRSEPVAISGPRGRVFSDLEAGDVIVSIAFGPTAIADLGETPGAGAMLIEEALGSRLTTRLRKRAGLTYAAGCRAHPVGGEVVWEVSATSQPGQAPLLWAEMEQELDRIAAAGLDEDEWARARLRLAGRVVSAFDAPDSAMRWLLRMAEFGDPGDDPPQDVLAVAPEAIAPRLPTLLDPGRRVFTVVGPMFEEDIDQFRISSAGESQ